MDINKIFINKKMVPLVTSDYLKIGKDITKTTSIDVRFKTIKNVGIAFGKRILGVPINFIDSVENIV